jgi:hypothetical protein
MKKLVQEFSGLGGYLLTPEHSGRAFGVPDFHPLMSRHPLSARLLKATLVVGLALMCASLTAQLG